MLAMGNAHWLNEKIPLSPEGAEYVSDGQRPSELIVIFFGYSEINADIRGHLKLHFELIVFFYEDSLPGLVISNFVLLLQPDFLTGNSRPEF